MWFTCVQLVQLSWMSSIEFQGVYILFVYGALCALLGVQFSFLSVFLRDLRKLSALRILAAASLWTVIEWSRLKFLCGFTWNPVGLSLTAWIQPLQFAAIWGVYGLSFWVMFVNLVAVKLFFASKENRKQWATCWVGLALIPMLFGVWHLKRGCISGEKQISAALVQTGLLPSQKVPLPGRYDEFISPLNQWSEILRLLKNSKREHWDLVVLPEAVVPYPATDAIYLYTAALKRISQVLGEESVLHQPPLIAPYAQLRELHGEKVWCVTNAFWGQLISNHFSSEVIAGLDHHDLFCGKNYNAAFHFFPFQREILRYDKRVLLPLAEYLPFSFLKKWTQNYGIVDFFTPGSEALVTGERVPLSLSVCYEETFADLMREGRKKGAELFVNVTNDSYYPNSRLPKQHFDHARLRAVENGIPLLRSANTGVTVALDRFGQVVAQLGEGGRESEWIKGVLDVAFKIETHRTLYSYWGDWGILVICVGFLLGFSIKKIMRMQKSLTQRSCENELEEKESDALPS
ncbi:MAG: apolipoprotein N-acyltransferase [Rhabdochlamydiaceae bacterium]|nr:apolipoprotein N-acyltransferase [Rhabdochlamydiaceae bacterium]